MKRDFPIHFDLQGVMEEQCFGELVEHTGKVEGYPLRVYYVCEECGEEFSASEVLNHDRDSSDWEFDMRYQGDY